MKSTIFILIVLFVWLAVAYYQHRSDGLLHFVTCDVGQGDALLVTYKSTQLLIDGGKDLSVVECLGRYVPFWDRTLELVVATHPDADHIGGLPGILSNYRVKRLMMNGEIKKTDDFEALNAAVQREVASGAVLLTNKAVTKISIGVNISLMVMPPLESSLAMMADSAQMTESLLSDVDSSKSTSNLSANDGSIVLLLTYNQVDVLLTGDLETRGEQALLEKGLIKDIEVLKVGHHGSKTGSSTQFLEVSKPEISVVSAGKNNRYGHPSPQVLRNLDNIHSKVLRTDLVGTIEVVTDGEEVWVKSKKRGGYKQSDTH